MNWFNRNSRLKSYRYNQNYQNNQNCPLHLENNLSEHSAKLVTDFSLSGTIIKDQLGNYNNEVDLKWGKFLTSQRINTFFHRMLSKRKKFEPLVEIYNPSVLFDTEIQIENTIISHTLTYHASEISILLDPPSSVYLCGSDLRLLNSSLERYKIHCNLTDIYTSINRRNQKPFESILPKRRYIECKRLVSNSVLHQNKTCYDWDSDAISKEFLTGFKARLNTILYDNTPISRSTNF